MVFCGAEEIRGGQAQLFWQAKTYRAEASLAHSKKGVEEEGFGLIEFLVLFGSDVGPVDELFFIPVIHTVFRGLEGQQMRSISGVSPFCTF